MSESHLARLQLSAPAWHSFVSARPAATAFHHPFWAQLLADCYGYRPLVLALLDGAGEIIAGLPALEIDSRLTGRRWVSLPFTDHCPPPTRSSASLGELVAALSRDRGPASRLCVRAALPPVPGVYQECTALRHTLALDPDDQAVFSSFSKMHQRNIRKAERSGVRVVRGEPPESVATFYRLHLETRRRLGTPVQPWRFFDRLGKQVLQTGLGFVLLAYVGAVPVAGAVFLAWNRTVIYKYGASDPQYWGARPNNLLFWVAIRWACQNGFHTLDLGRTDLEDQGLRDFKCGWGAKEEPLVYSVLALRSPSSPGRRARQALSFVIRHSPPLFCRGIGELLYGHFA